MSLYFDNFGGSGKPAWTNTLAPPAPSKPSGPPPGMVYSQAQPIQPPSQGTPYGQQPAQQPKAAPKPADFSAYRPQPAQQASSNPFTQYNPQQAGNFVQQQMGLPSFQFIATDSFGNTYNNPAALTAQQGAMAQALNAQRAQQIQSGNIGRLDPMAAYQQAQNMVQGGWTNPFAQQPPVPNGGDRPPSAFNPAYMGGQAQPIQPPSQGNPYNGTPVPYAPSAPLGPAQPDPQRQRDQAAYEELMQQIRTGGGSMADNMRADRRRAALERRLGMTQAPSQPGAAQPIQPPSQGTPYGQFIDGNGDGIDDHYQSRPRPPRREGDAYYQPALPGGSMPSFGGGFSMPPQGQGPGSSFFPGGQAQPIQPPSQGTPYGQSLQASPARPGYTRTPDGRLLYSGQPEVGLQAPPRRGSFERDAVGMPVLRAPNDPANPTRPMPQPWMTTAFGGQVLSMPPRPTAPRRQPFFY